MPWKEVSTMSLRHEFVSLAATESIDMRNLCRRFAISPKTGYKWLHRFAEGGLDALCDHSRRPFSSPDRTSEAVEQVILQIRDQHPAWGPRKIKALLPENIHSPSVSTVAAILKRNGRVDPRESSKHKPWQRFEAQAPNDLWQMDYKGHFPLAEGSRCHPLTILDDHSRFLIALRACSNETGHTVQDELISTFRRYGLPLSMIMDNGSPWGSDADYRYTPLTAWLIQLGISVSHSRPYHPQTMGKDERIHRTIKAEILSRRVFSNIPDSQNHFDQWRDTYNFVRPHEALGMATPASRYRPSLREFPEKLSPIEYGPDCLVRKVQQGGAIYFHGRPYKIGNAFNGCPVALKPTAIDGLYDVFFCQERVAGIDLQSNNVIRY